MTFVQEYWVHVLTMGLLTTVPYMYSGLLWQLLWSNSCCRGCLLRLEYDPYMEKNLCMCHMILNHCVIISFLILNEHNIHMQCIICCDKTYM